MNLAPSVSRRQRRLESSHCWPLGWQSQNKLLFFSNFLKKIWWLVWAKLSIKILWTNLYIFSDLMIVPAGRGSDILCAWFVLPHSLARSGSDGSCELNPGSTTDQHRICRYLILQCAHCANIKLSHSSQLIDPAQAPVQVQFLIYICNRLNWID